MTTIGLPAHTPTGIILLTSPVRSKGGRLDSYREHLLAAGLSPKSVRVYESKMAAAMNWCRQNGTSLYTIPPSKLVEMAAAVCPNTSSSRRQLRSALAHYWTMIGRPDPPAKAVRVPRKKPGRCRALDPDDARLLAKSSVGWYPEGLAVLLGLFLGLRAYEISSAEWQRFDGGWYEVLGKGDRTRHLPVHPRLADELARTRRCAPHLFPGARGRPHVTEATIWNFTRRVSAEAGLDHVQPHVLRHTCLATMNDGTGDLRATQEFAGHARAETTQIYTRVVGERLEAAVASLDFLG